MNSFLQMMFMIPEFRHEMLQWKLSVIMKVRS